MKISKIFKDFIFRLTHLRSFKDFKELMKDAFDYNSGYYEIPKITGENVGKIRK